MTTPVPSNDNPPETQTALVEFAQQLDLIVLAGATAAWTLQAEMQHSLVDALLPRPGESPDSWEFNARSRVWRFQTHPRWKEAWTSTLDGIERDIAEAARAAGLTGNGKIGDLGAKRFLDHAAGAWRTGMQGLSMNAQQAISGALADLRNGTKTLPQAVRAAATGMLENGSHVIRDSAGRRWQPASYSEMVLRTASQQAHTSASLNAAADGDTPYIVVSDAHRECARCRPWERRILRYDSITDDVAGATLNEARAAGLHHPHCRHQVYPWWPEWDDQPIPANPSPALYRASQQQRRAEREVRQARLRVDAERVIDNRSPEYRAARERLAARREALKAHLAANPGLKRSSWREVPRPGDRLYEPAPRPTASAQPTGPTSEQAKRAARLRAIGLNPDPSHGNVHAEHEVRFYEQFVADGQQIRLIPKDVPAPGAAAKPTNDFTWLNQGIEIEVKSSLGKPKYATIKGKLQNAAAQGKRNFIVDIGDQVPPPSLLAKLRDYNNLVQHGQVERLWLWSRGELILLIGPGA